MNAFAIIQVTRNTLGNLFNNVLRSSGRTDSILREVKNGSIVVVVDSRDGEYIKRRAREKGMSIEYVCDKYGNLSKIHELVRGRKFTSVHFEHRFVEKMIEGHLDVIKENIEGFSDYATKPTDYKPLKSDPGTHSGATWLGSIKDEGI